MYIETKNGRKYYECNTFKKDLLCKSRETA